MKIGFYGDSYCVGPALPGTYMDIIKNKLNATIVHTGFGGSSIWDVFLKQFDRNNVPDINIFLWTHSIRLYHPVYRDLTAKRNISNEMNSKIIDALDYYYTYLHFDEKMQLETNAVFYWFDHEILSKISKHKKVIHLWSIGERENLPTDFNWLDTKWHQVEKIKYLYRWKTGVEIRPALFPLSLQGNTLEQNSSYLANETRLNHLEEHKHILLASWIENALVNYSNGLLLDFSRDLKL